MRMRGTTAIVRHAGAGTLLAMSSAGGLYAAYGSNMDPEQMLERCPHSPAAGTGWLNGWRLTFGGEELGWDGALAMVVPDAASQVFVALYEMSAGPRQARLLGRRRGGPVQQDQA